jgi:hypothetical protein
MSSRFLPSAAALIAAAMLAASCGGDAPQAEPTAPTAPGAPAASAAAVAADSTEITALPDDASWACHAYLERRNALREELASAPGDEDLLLGIKMINGFLSENCR